MNMRPINFHIVIIFFITGVLMVYQGFSPDLLADNGEKAEIKIEITLKENNIVKSSHIFLGDIADIRAQGFLKETLEKIDLGLSPKPDKIRSIDKRKILTAIQRQQHLPKDIVITCPDRIYVKRMSRETSVQDIRIYVEQRLSEVFKNKEVQLTTFNVRGLEPYPSGDTKFFSDSEDMVDKNGKLSLFVDIIVDGKKTDRVTVSGLVDIHPLIQKGDRVSLFARNDTLLIVTTGISLEDGFENDVIKVENLNSGKVIRGKIKEKSKVEVIY